MARVEERPSARDAETADASASGCAEPVGRSDVELDVVLAAARRHGASRVEHHGSTYYFDSWQGRSNVHSKQQTCRHCNAGRTARQRRSATRNTRAAFEQRQAEREQRKMSATADGGSFEKAQPAGAVDAAAADEEQSVSAATDGRAEQPRMATDLAPAAEAAVQPAAPLLEQPQAQQPEPPPEPEPAPAPPSSDEETDEAMVAAAAAAEAAATAAITATATAAAASAAAGAPVAGEAVGAAERGVGMEAAGATSVDERRATPAGAGKRKRQAVAAACGNDGASSRASVGAPLRARAGVQCEGQCAGGQRCGVWSIGSSAPAWVSAPLRSGARCCKTHEPQRVAARAAKAAAKAARPSGGRGAGRRAGVQPAAAQGVQRAGATRRAAAANGNTAGMAAAIMAARGK